jgi:hypothetical protein
MYLGILSANAQRIDQYPVPPPQVLNAAAQHQIPIVIGAQDTIGIPYTHLINFFVRLYLSGNLLYII